MDPLKFEGKVRTKLDDRSFIFSLGLTVEISRCAFTGWKSPLTTQRSRVAPLFRISRFLTLALTVGNANAYK